MSPISELNNASYIFGTYLPLICFIFGIIGVCLNCILLTRRMFRNNPCSTYFLGSTYANLVVILINNLVGILQSFGNIQIATMNIGFCKFQRYMSWMFRSLSIWLIVLATIDRYLNSFSDVNIRSWSSMKIAKRSIFLTTFLIMIIYFHMLIFYQLYNTIDSNGNIISTACNPLPGFYAIFSSILYVIVYSCLPIILMFIFGILTLRNIKRQRQLIAPVNINNVILQQQPNQLNNQLLRVLLVQILIITISTLPLSIQRVYGAIATESNKSSYRIVQENLFSNMAQGFSYIAHSTNFYVFTLTGRIFRQELKRLFIKFINFFHFVNNNIRITDAHRTQTIQLQTRL